MTGQPGHLGDHKYVALTTYRQSGEAVATPVWAVPMGAGVGGGDRFGFWTSSQSGKAKRINRNPQVTVQPCDVRGRVTAGTVPVSGSAAVATAAELEEIRIKVRAKYGFMTKLTKFLNVIGGLRKGRKPYGDIGIVVTMADRPA